MRQTLWGILGLIGSALIALAPAQSRAELLDAELRLHRLGLTYGTGTARLDGMMLNLAVRDENDEINLFDFGDNPAGLLSDRDSWSVDFRFGHDEFREKNPALNGFLFKSNSYSFLGTTRSGVQAFGGGFDYLDSSVERRVGAQEEYKNGRLRFIYNRRASQFDVGAELRYLTEDQSVSETATIYPISHRTNVVTGVFGLSYRFQDHFRVAGRGTLRSATTDGLSAADSHEDKFTWDRPAGTVEGQFFVNAPRLEGGVTLGRLKGAGEEKLRASWSRLFVFNPTLASVTLDRRTFTEDRDATQFRTRWRYDVTPDFLTLAASFEHENSHRTVVASQNTIGSATSSDVKQSLSDLGLGGAFHLLEDRLLLAGEFHAITDRYEDLDEFEGFTNKQKTASLGFGAEYLVRENLAARTGLVLRSEDRNPDRNLTGTFGSTSASFGLGLIPAGGALQLDAAYSFGMGSELDVEQSGFALYARLLF